ncbi:unknown [Crocosphaera subtropica ATCC 51142]|uniref:Uncharacterized protein n=1 Tax=Crocosphaera subtropica (strain ATCC 51142 / BH68) TaxID=43989 RepID=B1WQE8_CROS5|nr:hypothetical protein [Crocosphaera subtropica]ACB51659.1 unknown [Crocosphaera subtropica ATCC 51142]
MRKSIIKKILPAFLFSAILPMTLIQESASAGEAFCVIKGAYNEILFRDQCIFEQFGGNGSFSIWAKSGLIANRESISVYIVQPGIAEVRGLTTAGINSRWGEAKRSNSDRACWVGEDFTICAY